MQSGNQPWRGEVQIWRGRTGIRSGLH